MINRAELKMRGKAAFLKNYWICVLVCVVLALLSNGGLELTKRINSTQDAGAQTTVFQEAGDAVTQLQQGNGAVALMDNVISRFVVTGVATVVALSIAGIGICFAIFICNPIEVGGKRFFLDNRERKGEFGALGFAFQNRYMNIVGTMLRRGISIFLWTLLLIVPGIIKGFEYMLVPYILAERPDTDSSTALRLSREMMYGYKMEAFWLLLSFLGWGLLSAITSGIIGVFWTNPYFYSTEAEFYTFLRERYLHRGTATSQGTTHVDYDSDKYKGPEF